MCGGRSLVLQDAMVSYVDTIGGFGSGGGIWR